MQTHSAKRSTELYQNARRHRRTRFWVGVVCAAMFGALALMAYAGLDQIIAPGHEVAAAPPPSAPNAASKATGHLVWVDSDGCTVSNFDNLSGQLSLQRTIPCSQYKNMGDKHQQSPQNRFKKFNSGFQK